MKTKVKVDVEKMPPLSVEEAKALNHGQVLYHRWNRNADGSAQRWRVSSQVKRWKREPDRVEFSVKYGLYGNDRVSNAWLDLLSTRNGE